MARSTKSATIFDDLLAVTGITKRKGDTTEEFKEKLFQAIDDLPDAKYEALPTVTQQFVNKALRAIGGKDGHEKNTLLPIPGYDDEQEAAEKPKASSRERIRDDEEDAAKAPAAEP